MSNVFNMVGGRGAAGEAFAVISVIYLEGAICTCSNGTITLTAKDTSGLYNFNIPSAGSWTVEATLSGETKRETVSITTKYQSVTVRLNGAKPADMDSMEIVATTGGTADTNASINHIATKPCFAIAVCESSTTGSASYPTPEASISNMILSNKKSGSHGDGYVSCGIFVGTADAGDTITASINTPSGSRPQAGALIATFSADALDFESFSELSFVNKYEQIGHDTTLAYTYTAEEKCLCISIGCCSNGTSRTTSASTTGTELINATEKPASEGESNGRMIILVSILEAGETATMSVWSSSYGRQYNACFVAAL